MSSENVEIARRTLEAWQRDDLVTWLSYLDEDVEYHAALERAVQGAGGAYVGHDGALKLWNVWRTEVEDLTIESLELREAPDGRVVHRTHARWRGAASGIEMESPLVLVLTVRDGKIVRSVDYRSHEEASKPWGWRSRRCRSHSASSTCSYATRGRPEAGGIHIPPLVVEVGAR